MQKFGCSLLRGKFESFFWGGVHSYKDCTQTDPQNYGGDLYLQPLSTISRRGLFPLANKCWSLEEILKFEGELLVFPAAAPSAGTGDKLLFSRAELYGPFLFHERGDFQTAGV